MTFKNLYTSILSVNQFYDQKGIECAKNIILWADKPEKWLKRYWSNLENEPVAKESAKYFSKRYDSLTILTAEKPYMISC